jgi:hypothetical protein
MQRSIQRSACAVLALFALSLTGTMMQCPWKNLTVEIPDLEVNQIEGMQLWRADQEAGQNYAEAGRVFFGEYSFLEDGSEVLDFTMVDAQGQPVDFLTPAMVLRGENQNGPVTLVFFFTGWNEPPGWIRVTTFNAVGESELSDEAAFL